LPPGGAPKRPQPSLPLICFPAAHRWCMPTQMNTQWASPAWAISWCGPSLRPDPTSQVGAARWLAGWLAAAAAAAYMNGCQLS
jgi:hypothetical protein